MKTELQIEFNRMLFEHRKFNPKAGCTLRGGGKDLDQLADFPLPSLLIELLTLHDGESEEFDRAMPVYPALLGIQSMQAVFESRLASCKMASTNYVTCEPNEAVLLNEEWRSGWFPFAQFNTEIWFVDTQPGPKGQHGQVVKLDLATRIYTDD
jgi:cell wall assembly regulator SMI1